MPTMDEGDTIVSVEALPSINLDEMIAINTRLQSALLARVPDVKGIVARTGSDELGLDPMGPNQTDPPGLPQWEWCQVPENQLQHSHKAIYQCNFMQALEGELDTTHVYFLHSRLDPTAAPSYGLYAPDRRARLEIVEKPPCQKP